MYAFALKGRAAPSRRDADMGAAAAVVADDVAAPSVVSDISVVPAGRKRYRAVVCRSITETAVVEFEAEETARHYDMAEDLIKQVPDAAWSRVDAGYGYIDRIEEIDPASASDA